MDCFEVLGAKRLEVLKRQDNVCPSFETLQIHNQADKCREIQLRAFALVAYKVDLELLKVL